MVYIIKDEAFRQEVEDFQKKLSNLHWKKNPDWFIPFKNYEDEQFKQIEGYFGFYFISNYGQVIDFNGDEPQQCPYSMEGKFRVVTLSRQHQQTVHLVHELVYSHFVRLKGDDHVYHRNGNPEDNYYKNLRIKKAEDEWAEQIAILTQPDPVHDSQAPESSGSSNSEIEPEPVEPESPVIDQAPQALPEQTPQEKKKGRNSRVIYQFDLDGKFIAQYPSISIAAKTTKSIATSIVLCASGKLHSASGYQWRYASDKIFVKGPTDIPPKTNPKPTNLKPVLQFDLDGNYIATHESIRAACDAISQRANRIWAAVSGKISTCGGFQWRYKHDPLFKKGIVPIPSIPPEARPMNNSVPILQYDLDGNFIREFSSISEAVSILRISRPNIIKCLKGQISNWGKFQFRYKYKKVDPNLLTAQKIKKARGKSGLKFSRGICQFSIDGKFLKEFPSVREAARANKISVPTIMNSAKAKSKPGCGYQWRYRDDPIFKKGIVNVPPIPDKSRALPVSHKSISKVSPKPPRETKPVKQKKLKPVPALSKTQKISKPSIPPIPQKNKTTAKAAKSDKNPQPLKLRVFQYSKTGKMLNEFPNITAAADATALTNKEIETSLKTGKPSPGGFIWKTE